MGNKENSKKDLSYQIGDGRYENRLNIYKGGTKIASIDGDQFDTNFRIVPAGDIVRVAHQILQAKQRTSADKLDTLEPGDNIEAAYYQDGRLKGVSGQLLEVDNGIVRIMDDKKGIQDFNQESLFSMEQAKILQKAFRDRMPERCIKLIMNNDMSPEEMELFRFGLKYGLKQVAVQSVIDRDISYQEKTDMLSTAIRARRVRIAKEINLEGYVVNDKIIRKLDALNLRTGREHTIDDISKIFQDKLYIETSPDAQNMVDDLAMDFAEQDRQRHMPGR